MPTSTARKTRQQTERRERHGNAGEERQGNQNIGDTERLVSSVLGGALLIGGLARRSWPGLAIAATGVAFFFRGATGHCPVYESIRLDTNRNTSKPDRSSGQPHEATRVEESIEVNKPAAELYAFWRHFENLPSIMSHLRSVERINDRVSHWVANTIPVGPNVEWDAEITDDVPNESIGWRSLKGADVDSAGSVKFVPSSDNQRTTIFVTLHYTPPAGRLGVAIASLIGEDAVHKIQDDLKRFKAAMESQSPAAAGSRSAVILDHDSERAIGSFIGG